MKIVVEFTKWSVYQQLTIDWDAPYLPRVGDAIELACFLSDEDKIRLENIPASQYGYDDRVYENALIAIDDDITAKVIFTRWFKSRETGETYALLLME